MNDTSYLYHNHINGNKYAFALKNNVIKFISHNYMELLFTLTIAVININPSLIL